MAISINYIYSTHTDIVYCSIDPFVDHEEEYVGKLDDITEHVCDMLIKYNFESAVVSDHYTGEIIAEYTRT